MRPSKVETYMEVCDAVKKRSHDAETQVGAVLVNNDSGAIIATGCNGFARGADEAKLPNTRPDKYQYIIHAEQNLVANCARHGISMNNCTLVCTLSPCVNCMRLIFQCGITKVIVRELYKDFDNLMKMEDIKITLVLNTQPNGLYELTYTT